MTAYRPPAPSFGPFKKMWTRFWMRFAGYGALGRLATRLATWAAPYQHKEGYFLANLNPRGYIAPSATISHRDVSLGENVFIGERVLIYQRKTGGRVELGSKVRIYRDCIIETGHEGYLTVGERSNIHPRCQLNAYVAPIRIGSRVGIAPNCAFYSYNHSFEAGDLIHDQGLLSKGPIVVGDDAWLGVGVIVLSGVTIGRGAVIGAGSVVTQDVPDGAIAVGNPARVVKMRGGKRTEEEHDAIIYG